jgi:hypothetical protein
MNPERTEEELRRFHMFPILSRIRIRYIVNASLSLCDAEQDLLLRYNA